MSLKIPRLADLIQREVNDQCVHCGLFKEDHILMSLASGRKMMIEMCPVDTTTAERLCSFLPRHVARAYYSDEEIDEL